jgi:PKD repeat protein
VVLTAENTAGSATAILTLIIGRDDPSAAPVISNAATRRTFVGENFVLRVAGFTWPVAVSATGLPPGLSVDYRGDIIGSATVPGTYPVTITASNSEGTSSAVITLQVDAVPPVPVISSAAATRGVVGAAFNFKVAADAAASPQPSRYDASNLPPGLGISLSNGYIRGTPTSPGVFEVPISVTNAGGVGTGILTITIDPVSSNDSELNLRITSPPSATARLGDPFSYAVLTEGDAEQFSATGLPFGLSINSQSGYITGTPGIPGEYPVFVRASNAKTSVEAKVLITVAAGANQGILGILSIISPASAFASVGTSFKYETKISYPQGQGGTYVLSFGASELPPGLAIDPATGVISGVPTQAGEYSSELFSCVGFAPGIVAIGTAVVTFYVTDPVLPLPAAAPVVNSAAGAKGSVGSQFSYSIKAAPAATTYSATGVPPGLNLNPVSGSISGFPTVDGNYPVVVSASNAAGTGSATVMIRIAPRPLPTITGEAFLLAGVGEPFSEVMSATGASTLNALNLPPGLTFNVISRVVSGVPTTAGTYEIAVSASNGAGTSNAIVTVVVKGAKPPRVTSNVSLVGTTGVAFNSIVRSTGSQNTFQATNLPAGLTIDSGTGEISGTPTIPGIFTVPIAISGVTGTGTAVLTLTIKNRAPAIITSSAEVRGVIGTPYSTLYRIASSEPGATYGATGLPPGLTFDPVSGEFSGTPTVLGRYRVPITATTSAGIASATLTIVIVSEPFAPAAPYITSAAGATALVGEPFWYRIFAWESVRLYEALDLPSGLHVDSVTGVISGVPTSAGVFTATLRVSNGAGSGFAKLMITVLAAAAEPPVITSPAMIRAVAGSPVSIALTATNQATRFSAANLPAGLTLDANTGVISGTAGTASTSMIQVTATNAVGTGTAIIRLAISESGDGNYITSSAGATGIVGSPFSYEFTSVTSLVYKVEAPGLPLGLTLNSATGKISGTPVHSGVTWVNVTASQAANYPGVIVTINLAIMDKPLSAPVISSRASASASVGSNFRYNLTASGMPIKFEADALPPGLRLDGPTGVIFGRPSVAGRFEVPVYAQNEAGIGAGILTLEIQALPRLPRIGNNATANGAVGERLMYDIVAGDVPSAYSAAGLPPGLSMDTESGKISGIPTEFGTYPAEITAENSAGETSVIITFIIDPNIPDVATEAVLVGTRGAPFLEEIGRNSSSTRLSFAGLPPGLVGDPALGSISGIPTSAGLFPITVTASNAASTLPATVMLVIESEPPVPIPDADIPQAVGTVGATFTYDARDGSEGEITRYSAVGLPPGLSMSADTGQILGVPTLAGTYWVTITLKNTAGSISETISIRILNQSAPVVTSSLSVRGFVNGTLSYSIIGTDSPTSYTATGLPPGMSVHPQLGIISGNPTSVGVFIATISATNVVGAGVAEVRFEIAPTGKPEIVSAAGIGVATTPIPTGKYELYPQSRLPVDYVIVATNGPTSYAASNLPPGINFDPPSGRISGVPGVAGKYLVPIAATNAAGTTNAILTIEVLGSVARVIREANVLASVGEPITHALTAYPKFSGLSPFILTYRATNLPPGLSLNSVTGVVTGTPAIAGTFPVEFHVTNAAGTGKSTITFIVRPSSTMVPSRPPSLEFTRAGFVGAVGVPFSAELTANGSPGQFTAAGLPPGFSLRIEGGVVNGSATQVGKITGTPTTPGKYIVPISASNASGTARATVTITVIAGPSAPVITSPAVARGVVGRGFTYPIVMQEDSLTALVPKAYSVSGLPAGLHIDGATGVISGVPTQAGSFRVPLNVAVREMNGTATLSIEIAETSVMPDVPRIAAAAGALGFVGVPFKFTASTLNRADTLGAVSLPPGLTLAVSAGPGESSYLKSVTIAGVPTTAGVYTVPFSATNSDGTASAVTTIRIIEPQVSRPTITQQPIDQVVSAGQDAVFAANATGAPGVTFQWMRNGAPIFGANAATLHVFGVKQSDDAVYRVQVSNAAGVAESEGAQLAVIVAYDTWMETEFTAEEIGSGRAGATADLNGDGISNLLEYSLGRDPRTGVGGTFPTISKVPGTNRIRLHFTRDARKPDLTYTVETSNDLRNWTPIARSITGGATVNLGGAGNITETGGAVRAVTVDDGPEGLGVAERFLRLKVGRQ